MRLSILAVAAVALIASSPLAFAAQGGAKVNAPGQEMQKQGSVIGSPGASGYAPGHLKKKAGVRSASTFAPRHVKKKTVHVPVRANTGAAVR
jgi:hypothetical protein